MTAPDTLDLAALAAVPIAQCDEQYDGRRCALVAGHGCASIAHIRGDVVDGHLYPRGNDDLSNEIRAQCRLDEIDRLRGCLATAEDEVRNLRDRVVELEGETATAEARATAAEEQLARQVELDGRVAVDRVRQADRSRHVMDVIDKDRLRLAAQKDALVAALDVAIRLADEGWACGHDSLDQRDYEQAIAPARAVLGKEGR